MDVFITDRNVITEHVSTKKPCDQQSLGLNSSPEAVCSLNSEKIQTRLRLKELELKLHPERQHVPVSGEKQTKSTAASGTSASPLMNLSVQVKIVKKTSDK